MHPLLLETDATVMFQQMTYIDAYINFILATCSPPNAKTTIGRYQHINRPMPITGRLSLNLWCLRLAVRSGFRLEFTSDGSHCSNSQVTSVVTLCESEVLKQKQGIVLVLSVCVCVYVCVGNTRSSNWTSRSWAAKLSCLENAYSRWLLDILGGFWPTK